MRHPIFCRRLCNPVSVLCELPGTSSGSVLRRWILSHWLLRWSSEPSLLSVNARPHPVLSCGKKCRWSSVHVGGAPFTWVELRSRGWGSVHTWVLIVTRLTSNKTVSFLLTMAYGSHAHSKSQKKKKKYTFHSYRKDWLWTVNLQLTSYTRNQCPWR